MMAITMRTATSDDLHAMFERDQQAFSFVLDDVQRAAITETLELDRFRVVHDGGQLIGVAGSFGLELTLPGGAQVPMGGVTWVSVASTHRRRGILRQLIADVHADIDNRDEPVAGLLASEGSIYERFGYGVSTRSRVVTIDPKRTRFAAEAPGEVRLIDPRDHIEELAERFDRYRRQQVGEVSRLNASIRRSVNDLKPQPIAALHDDGYAVWTVTANWGEAEPAHDLRVFEFAAITPEAHAALWNLILSTDLIGRIDCRTGVTLDDALPGLLTDQREVRTSALHDFQQLCPRRVEVLLAARRYRVADRVVVEVDGERWELDGGPDGAEVRASTDEPLATMTRAAMGSLILGGTSATELVANGRMFADEAPRLDAFFGWAPLAHSLTAF